MVVYVDQDFRELFREKSGNKKTVQVVSGLRGILADTPEGWTVSRSI